MTVKIFEYPAETFTEEDVQEIDTFLNGGWEVMFSASYNAALVGGGYTPMVRVVLRVKVFASIETFGDTTP